MNLIHAHHVLNMLLAAEAPYSMEGLKQAIIAEYGENVRFYTCSQQGLTFDALMAFLLDRRKITQDGDQITANRERMCNH